ncbi:hypothetical protein CR513_16233, partial [Mucuna pruriens]
MRPSSLTTLANPGGKMRRKTQRKNPVTIERDEVGSSLENQSGSVKAIKCRLPYRDEANDKPSYHNIKKYTHKGTYPQGATENNKRTLRRLVTGFSLSEPVLYKKEYGLNTTPLRRRPKGKRNHRGSP